MRDITQNKKLLIAPALAAITDTVYYLSSKGSWALIGLFAAAVIFTFFNIYFLFKSPKLVFFTICAALLLLAPITDSMLVGGYWYIYGFAP